ncbi:MAG: SIMPL domain-containing protein [Candidatus Dormibacteraceae bacterium]
MASIRVALASVAAAALVALVVVVAAGRPPIFITSPAASSTTGSIEGGVFTSGDASVSKKPDTAFLFAGVESQQSTASAAQSDLASKAAKLIARVKALGVVDKDLNTSGYSVGPVYTPSGQTVSGYRAAEQLQITWHDVNTVGKALDAIVQEGGATNVGASFGLADLKGAQAEARNLAIADARARAQAMASAAGVRLGPVIRVSDLSSSGLPSARFDVGAAAPVATQLPVGELTLAVTVEVDFAIA